MKLEFRNPTQTELIVFDGESLQDLEYILIKIINPKIVITSIDNSFKFSDLK